MPQGTKAVLQPQAAEIIEIAPEMPIGLNAVTHNVMAEAKREVIMQDPDTVFSGCAQIVKAAPGYSIKPLADNHDARALFLDE